MMLVSGSKSLLITRKWLETSDQGLEWASPIPVTGQAQLETESWRTLRVQMRVKI